MPTAPNYVFELLQAEALPPLHCQRVLRELGYGTSESECYALAQILESLVAAKEPLYRTQFVSGIDVLTLARWLVTRAANDCRISPAKQQAAGILAGNTTDLWLLLTIWARTRKAIRHLQLQDARAV